MCRYIIIPCLICTIAFGSLSCSRKETLPPKPELVERFHDIAVVSAKVPGFDKLSLQDKRIAYHLSRAAIAGRDLAYDQTHRHALKIRNLLEEIITHPQDTPWETLEKINLYLKHYWTFTGPYDNQTYRKFLPQFNKSELIQAAESALSHGANFGIASPDELHALIDEISPTLFDPDTDPILTNKSPVPPHDILMGSAVNYYQNITLAEAEDFDERYPLNSLLIKDKDGIHEDIYRSGSPDVPPGRMAQTIAKIIEELDQARVIARPSQQKVLTHLIKYLETGEPEEFRQANIAWLQDQSPVDFTIGFIEVYRDPRGQKGFYQGLVYTIDSTRTKIMQQMAQHIAEFQAASPWDPAYKNPDPVIPTGKAINVIMGVGGTGPICPGGINLPNDDAIKEIYGSKNVILTNTNDAARMVWGNVTSNEFTESEKIIAQWDKWGNITRFLTTSFHEIVGHGTEIAKPETVEQLGEYTSTICEARADLVALYFMPHPLSQELGIVPHPDCGEILYRRYVRSDLLKLHYTGNAPRFESDHARGHHMIVEYLRQVTGAVDTVRQEGKLYLVVTDLQKMQEGVTELLIELTRIRATGDYQAACDLIETYGVPLNTAWRDEVRRRMETLDLPEHAANIMPELTLDALPLGRVNDVHISYPRDFIAQMLSYSGKLPQQTE